MPQRTQLVAEWLGLCCLLALAAAFSQAHGGIVMAWTYALATVATIVLLRPTTSANLYWHGVYLCTAFAAVSFWSLVRTTPGDLGLAVLGVPLGVFWEYTGLRLRALARLSATSPGIE